jgi:hypothetical protein
MTQDDIIAILASNFDKLDLAIYAQWFDDTFLKQLEEMKAKAIANRRALPIELKPLKINEVWKGSVQPHGANGYAFLILGNEYNLKFGNWVEPIDRPSVYVEIRSETLWRLGPQTAIDHIVDILKGQGTGALIEKIVPSRVDLCVDALFPLTIWGRSLLDYKVTFRPTKTALYLDKGGEIEGLAIGRGKISCRLYNKGLEIKTQSKKFWMYAVWGIAVDDVPKHMRIIRIEFQLRREVSIWGRSLLDYKVTFRPTKTALYLDKGGEIEGLAIGRGKISCRLYNKGLEIKTQSKKFWMYAVWGIAVDDIETACH